MHGIKGLMAKNYIDNLCEETKKGMLEKAEQSIYPSCAPIGYRNVMRPNGKRIIEPDPIQGPIIKQMFEWYATCSNSVWKDQTLTATLRQPFDLLAVTNTTWQREKAAGTSSNDLCPIWQRIRDSNP